MTRPSWPARPPASAQWTRRLLTKAALRRLDVLIAAEKAKKLKPGEDTELADLRALKDRVETTNRALKRKDVEQIMDASGQGTVATLVR